ncbi:GNAT family N-acetyltransferase [Solimicrobium silvestre]|uniref:Acetyltransferase (GNAT) domain n=1 Tax=Solimicrobium silvestre TaxID=2099400 RepID=A0A2S9H4V3_9BURK|nr:GNAT family N-acetyltransferase [Solimicrobium silvestre]PRC95009.1 Acetyltransferase (GNAT) domain [Solimicrobium silvestre]
MQITHPNTALRPINDTDMAFLKQVYGSTREEELRQTNWNDAQKTSFIDMQFQAQHSAYSAYPNAEFFLILHDTQQVGRVYLQHRPDAILIIDLALLTQFRGRGIGSGILQSIFTEAQQLGKSVLIHVEKFNPALLLYQRLGFKLIADKGVYLLLEWQSPELVSTIQ